MVRSRRRAILATCALAMALGALGACSDDKPTKVLGEVIERSAASASPTSTAPSSPTTAGPAAPTTTASVTTTAAPSPTTAAPPATSPPATSPPQTSPPDTDPPQTLPPPVIQVLYQVPDGSTGNAAIDGPSGHLAQPLDSGVATFENLQEGVYEIVVSVDTNPPPTDGSGSTIGPAHSESRARVEVHAGDTATMRCSGYADCDGSV